MEAVRMFDSDTVMFDQLKSGLGVIRGVHGEIWRLKTSPQILLENASLWPQEVAMRKKRYGIWNSYTWKEYADFVKYFSLGLIRLGFKKQDKIAIIGDNDPEWWFCQLGAQAAGGVGFGIFIDCVPEEIKFFVQYSDASFVAAKDQEQCDKLLEIKESLPNVRKVIYWEPKGMWRYRDPWLMDFQDVVAIGKEYERSNPGLFEKVVAQGKVDDIACLAFTSGTTGLPKAAQISYRSLIAWNATLWRYYPAYRGEDYFSFLCPAWAVDQILGFVGCLQQGLVVNFPERPDTVIEDAREISSVIELAGARMWEERYRNLLVRIQDADWLKKTSFELAMAAAKKYERVKEEGQGRGCSVLFWSLAKKIADFAVFRPLRDRLGYVKARVCLVAGAMMSPELFRFFQTIGIPLYTYYGITEAGFIAMQHPGALKIGSCGKVLPGREVRIEEKDNHVLVRANNAMMFSGYYKNEAATKKAIREGWYYTGDAGYLDDEGYFFFMDRVSEMMSLSDGSKFSATYIESELRASRYIADAMVVGQGRDFVGALIQIDFKNVGQWAEANHISYNIFIDLSQKEPVYDLIAKEIRTINKRIPPHSQIRAFANLHKEFDADEAEMTRTRKLRRAPLTEKYRPIIDAIYDGRDFVTVTTEVKYRDGRRGMVEAQVKIRRL
jgi:long-chain acyl-CoA synthetase